MLGAAFYLWTAGSTEPLGLVAGYTDYYNQLANALLHFHTSIGDAPAGLVHLPNPYDPNQNINYQGLYHDLSLYHGRLYLDWGPAPVVVLLVPLHLLGLAASPSLTAALFSVLGLGFGLATLRLLIRQFEALPTWMGVLSAAVLVCSTSVPFILRRPAVYEEAIAAGYCFVMAGLLIAMRAILARRAALAALALMSLCFGLAAGSRPPLLASAILIVPVYAAVRATHSRRALLVALLLPVAACLVALLGYNATRFGSLLENGQSYQLSGYNPATLHFGQLSYLLPNLWYYGLAPPRPMILFPFLSLTPPPLTYPLSPPANYLTPELTGGLLTMAPLLVFAFPLPWLYRRRPQSVGVLARPLLVAGAVGLIVLLFLSYEFFSVTERYEVDFTALFLFVALAGWFALASGEPGRRRRAVRILGAVLAIWGCLAGVAISFTGYLDMLRRTNPTTYRSLEDDTSVVSTVMAMVAGRPILGTVQGPNAAQVSPVNLTSLGAGVQSLWLPSGTSAEVTIVSPDHRQAALVATMTPGAELGKGGTLSVQVINGSRPAGVYPVHAGVMRIPVSLHTGLNRVTIAPVASKVNVPNPTIPGAQQLLIVPTLTIAARY